MQEWVSAARKEEKRVQNCCTKTMHAILTWVVVVDAQRMRILATSGIGKGLRQIQVFANPAGHGFARDLGSDRPGRTRESLGKTRHALEPHVDPHRQAKHDFAAELAHHLEAAARAKIFERLVLVAPPQMLGDLRACLGRLATARLIAEIPKDLGKTSLSGISKNLSAALNL
jgi:protein required for attachment to host cells